MSQVPKYTGQWTDWSDNFVLGNKITLSVRNTLFLVGATTVLVTFVAGALWSIWSLLAHRYLATRSNPDFVTLHQRLVYRNNTSADASLKEFLGIYRAWKSWHCAGIRGRSGYPRCPVAPRPRGAVRVGRQTCYGILPALLIFAGLLVAGVFATQIAHDAYKSNAVLVDSNYKQGMCGITFFNGNQISSRVPQSEKVANDTRAAIAYARSCYRQVIGIVNRVACTIYVSQTLKYTTEASECPFGEPGQLFKDSVCNANGVQSAWRLLTHRLDSHKDLGINARPRDRVQFQKELICSPLVTDGFTSSGSAHGTRLFANTTITNFNYGPVQGISDYSWSYNTAAINDNVPFQVTALTARLGVNDGWIPVQNLTRLDADVTVIFIAPNSIRFAEENQDPIFKTTYCIPHLTPNNTVYHDCDPLNRVSVVGCTERYVFCNPDGASDRCTRLGGRLELYKLIEPLQFSRAQTATAYRLIEMINDGFVFTSIDGIGPDSLQIWNRVHNFLAPKVPANQWQIEIEGWMETTLAKWQAHIVEYAINTVKTGGAVSIGFPRTDEDLEEEFINQCSNQKISNLGAYQNLSVFGLAFIWTISLFTIILSMLLKSCIKIQRVALRRKDRPGPRRRRIASNLDGKFQMHRVALRSAGYTDVIGGEGDIPFLEGPPLYSLPFEGDEETVQGRMEGDTIYRRRSATTNGAPQGGPHSGPAVGSTNNSSPGGPTSLSSGAPNGAPQGGRANSIQGGTNVAPQISPNNQGSIANVVSGTPSTSTSANSSISGISTQGIRLQPLPIQNIPPIHPPLRPPPLPPPQSNNRVLGSPSPISSAGQAAPAATPPTPPGTGATAATPLPAGAAAAATAITVGGGGRGGSSTAP